MAQIVCKRKLVAQLSSKSGRDSVYMMFVQQIQYGTDSYVQDGRSTDSIWHREYVQDGRYTDTIWHN